MIYCQKKIFASMVLILSVSGSLLSFPQEKPREKVETVVALVGGTLIDGTGAVPLADAAVLFQGTKISAVGPTARIQIPKNAKVIDMKGKFILPGFIDCHIHTSMPYDELQYYTDTNSVGTLRALHIMDMDLRSGITALRDCGSPVEVMQALGRAQKLGYIDSIRLYPCGNLITVTGGHGDGIHGSMTADGPWEWRKAVRLMYKDGFRHIKISPTFTLEEAQAAVDEAKTLGLRITAHGGGLSDTVPTTMTKIAVQAGVHSIEHLLDMEDDVLDLIAQKGVYIVPTLSVLRELFRLNRINPFLIEKRHWTLALQETLFKKARQRKILMAIGTDALGPMYPDVYFTEMKYFTELGASNMEAIVAATRNGAIVLGMQDEIGTVETGKLADLQVVASDPLKSFDALGKPSLVIIGGKIYEF